MERLGGMAVMGCLEFRVEKGSRRQGRPGWCRDGKDGFSLDDFDVKSDEDGRTLLLVQSGKAASLSFDGKDGDRP